MTIKKVCTFRREQEIEKIVVVKESQSIKDDEVFAWQDSKKFLS